MAELAKRVKINLDMVKATIGSGFEDGERKKFRSPLDERPLGQIWRTDPEPSWIIVDRQALEAHLREFPGNMRPVIVGDEAEVLGILLAYAPHLIEDALDPSVIQDALDQSKATGEPAAPGIEFRKPGGHLTVKPDANAGIAIEAMIKAGIIAWDGQRAITDGRK